MCCIWSDCYELQTIPSVSIKENWALYDGYMRFFQSPLSYFVTVFREVSSDKVVDAAGCRLENCSVLQHPATFIWDIGYYLTCSVAAGDCNRTTVLLQHIWQWITCSTLWSCGHLLEETFSNWDSLNFNEMPLSYGDNADTWQGSGALYS